MTTPLWSHQEKTIEFITDKSASLIASGMGSGKSRIVIEYVARHIKELQLILIVVPKNVLDDRTWERQFGSYLNESATPGFTSAITIHLDKGTVAQKTSDMKEITNKKFNFGPRIFVINYDSVWRDPLSELILKIKWDMVVLDEAHRIKAAGSKVSKYFSKLARHQPNAKKIALTGTPTPNSPLDVYGIYRFLDPSIFGSNYSNFANTYAIFGGFNNYQILRYQHLDDLAKKMGRIAIRFKTEDVIDLPPTMDIDKYCTLSPAAMKKYKEFEKEFIVEIGDGVVTASNTLVKSLRLQQMASGHVYVDDAYLQEFDTAKKNLFSEVLDELPHQMQEGKTGLVLEPVVVFCRFTADVMDCAKVMQEKGYKVGYITGKRKDMDGWRDGSVDGLVVQIDAGNEGIDLTKACFAIYYSFSYDLGTYEQSRARLNRPGQTRPVRFVHLIASDTIDGVITRALHQKQRVNDFVYGHYSQRVMIHGQTRIADSPSVHKKRG